MSTNNLESLLSEYEQKRRKAEMDLDERIENLYKKFPELEEIDDEINQISIDKTKAILNKQNGIEEMDKEIYKLKKQKEEFLNKNNIKLEYFEPNYECKICKDTGYVQDINNKTVMCNCLKQKLLNLSYNKSNLSDIKKENFENFNINLFSDEINTQKYKIKCSPRQNMINIKNACMKFIENFDNLDEKSLLFVGNTGLGKTYMSNAIANELLKKGKTVLYQTAPVLLETIIDNKFNKYKNHNADNFYKNVLNVDLLIIDDLGTESINTLTVSELFTIINTRILNLNNKPTKTIISTNFSIEQIFKNYEERIGSRIAGNYNIYQFVGEDLRLKR
ncbi:MAG: ATP-binding protein [Clostridia bacterium]|nr:ATP-binding protein [Clostridia bacterium]